MSNHLRKFIKKNLGLSKGNFTYFNSKVYFPNNSLIFRMACDEGIYDKEVYDFIFTFLKEDGLFIDIGANIGLLSVPVLNVFERAEIISFEPSSSVLPSLLKTHKEHVKNTRWTIFETALGNSIGEVMFENNKDLDSAFDNVSIENSALSDTKNARKKVKISTLDKIIEIPAGKFSSVVMKIDVEGFEYKVLSGAVGFIQKHRPFIILEIVKEFMERYGTSINDFIELSNRLNYTIYGLSTLNKISNSTELEFSLKKNLNFMLMPNYTITGNKLNLEPY